MRRHSSLAPEQDRWAGRAGPRTELLEVSPQYTRTPLLHALRVRKPRQRYARLLFLTCVRQMIVPQHHRDTRAEHPRRRRWTNDATAVHRAGMRPLPNRLVGSTLFAAHLSALYSTVHTVRAFATWLVPTRVAATLSVKEAR